MTGTVPTKSLEFNPRGCLNGSMEMGAKLHEVLPPTEYFGHEHVVVTLLVSMVGVIEAQRLLGCYVERGQSFIEGSRARRAETRERLQQATCSQDRPPEAGRL